MTKEETNKKEGIKSEKGSAMVLVMVIMVIALFVTASISLVSIMEGEMSRKTRNSTPAIQMADIGVELTLKVIKDAVRDYVPAVYEAITVESICETHINGITNITASWDSDDYCEISFNPALSMSNDKPVKVYFLDGSEEKITDEAGTNLGNLMTGGSYIRVIGAKGSDEDEVIRAFRYTLFYN